MDYYEYLYFLLEVKLENITNEILKELPLMLKQMKIVNIVDTCDIEIPNYILDLDVNDIPLPELDAI